MTDTTEAAEAKIAEAHKSMDDAEAILAGKAPAKPTELVLILDRSGSMEGIRSSVEAGLESMLHEQRSIQGDVTITVAQFDTEYELLYTREPLAGVKSIVCEPRGMTALLDGIGITLTTVAAGRAADPKRPELVIVVVATDGMENASKEWTQAKINDLITARRKDGWQFVFLAANQDAILSGQQMGFQKTSAVNYCATERGTRQTYRALSQNMLSCRSGAINNLDFSDEQRKGAMSE